MAEARGWTTYQWVRALREPRAERIRAGSVADYVGAVLAKAIHAAELQRVFAGEFGQVRFTFIAVRYIQRAEVTAQAADISPGAKDGKPRIGLLAAKRRR